MKISDVSSHLYFTAKENFDFTLEYYMSRTTDGSINVTLMLYNKTSRKEALFLNTFGENPLKLDIKPSIESSGTIMYGDVITITDDIAIEKISDLYRQAYAEIQKYIL